MLCGHYYDAGAYVDYGAVTPLFPVDDLNAGVHTHRDAELVLSRVQADRVVAVRPTGLASSYALVQRPLVAIQLSSLKERDWETLAAATDIDLAEYEWLQVGRVTAPAQNHSLAEY